MKVREEFRLKNLLKKRWLYYAGCICIYLFPIIMIVEKTVEIKHKEVNVSFEVVGLFVGIIYIIFIAKLLKPKLQKAKINFFSTFIKNILASIPILTVACIISLTVRALNNFVVTTWVIYGVIVFGIFLIAIESEINKTFLYRLRIYEIAKERVDVAQEEKRINQELTEGDI